MIGVGVAGVALGMIIGVFITANMQADANQAITDAEKIQAQVAQEREELDSDLQQLEQKRNEVAQREQELGKRESELAKNERDLEEQRDEFEQARDEAPEPPRRGDRDRDRDRGDENAGFTFFFTCDDVRAAGRAPLPESDPSYRWDLDGNNNGQACEEGE